MICSDPMRRAILAGKKRQHRIPLSLRSRKHQPGEYLPIRKLETVFDYGRNIETTPVVCYVEILHADRELIDEITDEEAVAEGYEDREAFLADWHENHPRTPECWCVTWRVSENIRIPALTGRGDQEGYTRSRGSGLPEEPESIADREQMETWGKEGREGLAAEQREVWERERQKILDAIEVCRRHGITDNELFIVRKRLDRLDRKLAQEAA